MGMYATVSDKEIKLSGLLAKAVNKVGGYGKEHGVCVLDHKDLGEVILTLKDLVNEFVIMHDNIYADSIHLGCAVDKLQYLILYYDATTEDLMFG